MKSSLLKVLVYASILAVVALQAGCKEQTITFQINDVISDPGAFSGSLTVVGVVYAYAKDDGMILGVMDKKELQCTTPNCNKALLPIKVATPRPAIGDEVVISGAMVKKEWGYLMEAASVDVVAKHKLGGA